MAEWGNPVASDGYHRGRLTARRTRGTETSQYPEEEKSTEITLVAASERVPAQTAPLLRGGVVGPTDGQDEVKRSPLEWGAADGESPVAEGEVSWLVEFLSSALVPRNEARSRGDHPPRLKTPV
jgi:hypothetical protein